MTTTLDDYTKTLQKIISSRIGNQPYLCDSMARGTRVQVFSLILKQPIVSPFCISEDQIYLILFS